MPVDLAALLLLACAKVHFPCTQESRVRPAPGIPCALSDFEGDRRCITRTDFRRGNAEARHCERSEAIQTISAVAFWIAPLSLSSGARSRDPLARNDGLTVRDKPGHDDAKASAPKSVSTRPPP